MMDERLKQIKERLAEMRRLREMYVANLAKTAKTGAEIMQADEPDMYEQDIAWLIEQLEEMAPRAVEGAAEYNERDLVAKWSPIAGPPYDSWGDSWSGQR